MSDHYQALGLTPAATNIEVRKAYAQLARELHPDRFPELVAKARAEARFKDITEAFNVLSNDRARREYDGQRDKPRATTPAELAAVAFAEGQQLLEGRRYAEAAEVLKAATHHIPGEARYHAALGRALAGLPQASREAAEALEEALRLDPRQVATCVVLARLYVTRGMKLRARKWVEHGLRLQPRDPHLIELQGQVGDEPKPPDASGLRGLLKRR